MKAMLFAAGVGSRLGQETAHNPKCLVEVAGKSLLEYVIERLKACSVNDVMINIHHFSEMIIEFTKKHNNFGININFSHEESLLDTGGGINKVRDFFINESDFIIHNCDIYCEYPLPDLIADHRSETRVATLMTKKRDSSRGLYFDQNKNLIGWSEEHSAEHKSKADLEGFCGVHVASPSLFKYMPTSNGKFSILESYLKAVRSNERVVKHDIGNSYWIDVGKPTQLQELRQRLI